MAKKAKKKKKSSKKPKKPEGYIFGRPTKYTNKVIGLVLDYVKDCETKKVIPIIEDLINIIEVAESTIYLWAEKHSEFSESLNNLKRTQKVMLIRKGLDGSYNSTIGKLILAANHGMREAHDWTSGGKPMESPAPIIQVILSGKNGQ